MSLPKILIVEDESIVALDLKTRLSRLGYEVVGTVASGNEALRLTELFRPDIALMDIHLNGSMDGIETAAKLRAEFNTPVVYLSAHADAATLERAVTTEPFGYLTKPFAEAELHSTLDMALYKIKMEKRLRRHSAQLLNIVTAIPIGVALLDADYRIVIANPQATDFLFTVAGVTVGDIMRSVREYSIENLINVEANPKWHEIMVAGETERVFEATAMPVSSPDEDEPQDRLLSDYLFVIREVTADREVQQRAQLQDRLAAIGQFSAGIAHDFNNIMSGIVLNTQLIRMIERNLAPDLDRRLEAIRSQAARASDLIKQILDFSRASAVSIQTFELAPLLQELSKLLERVLPASIKLEISYPAQPCWIEGDPTRILQVLMNLVLNARDALPLGGTLSVEMSHYSGERPEATSLRHQREWTHIVVTDNGTGIQSDVIPHIFEPFFTTKDPGKGTGLGLAQVYGIIQQHGGHIDVSSQLGVGTSFSIYLPAVSSPSAAVDSPVSLHEAFARGHSQTILIVEDNLAARDTLVEVLELLNYRVLVASHGRAALAILADSANRVDLLLCDLIMPVMGGIELLRELNQRGTVLRTIVLSGFTSPADLASLHELGISRCLNKPVDIEKLSHCIEECLSEAPELSAKQLV